MKEIILLKYGELVLKGLNRSTFVALVEKNVLGAVLLEGSGLVVSVLRVNLDGGK